MSRPVAMAAGAGRRVSVCGKVEGCEAATRMAVLASCVRYLGAVLTPPNARLHEPLGEHVGRHRCGD
jgi:hypothetical protein